MTSPLRAYHHGSLRLALIEAGLAVVETDGVDALSLRAVARRANVSHAAPYHHFATKAELLAAVAASGFERLVAEIRGQIEAGASPAASAVLWAVGQGYMNFAFRNPGVFRLMFRPELTRPADHPALRAAEAQAFGVLYSTIMAGQASGEFVAGDPRPLAAFCWSTVHGMAMLHVDQVLQETPLGEMDAESLSQLVNNICLGGVLRR